MIQETMENGTQEESVKEPVIGKFKPKRKFLTFVNATKSSIGNRSSGIRFIGDSAFIKSEELTGTIEGVTFKVEICDEGTINFEEVDTNFCDEAMIGRFVEYIDSLDVTGYAEKYVVHGIQFFDKNDKRVYLEVEYKKPFDQLLSILDDIKPKPLQEGGMSILDSLFGDEEPEEIEVSNETETETITETKAETVEEAPKENIAQQMMREAFEKVNADKVQELKDRIENKEKNISKYKTDIRQAENSLKSDIEEHKVLSTRLESMSPFDAPNGFVFHVSVENKTGIEPDQSIKDVVAKIAPILKLREEDVLELLTNGYYTIKVADKTDISNTGISLTKELYEKISKIDIGGKVTLVSSTEFEYRGDLNWHQLVGKMLRIGFEQSEEFDKICDSNSYVSEYKEGTEEDSCECKDGTCGHDHNENLGVMDIVDKAIEDHKTDIYNKTDEDMKHLKGFNESQLLIH